MQGKERQTIAVKMESEIVERRRRVSCVETDEEEEEENTRPPQPKRLRIWERIWTGIKLRWKTLLFTAALALLAAVVRELAAFGLRNWLPEDQSEPAINDVIVQITNSAAEKRVELALRSLGHSPLPSRQMNARQKEAHQSSKWAAVHPVIQPVWNRPTLVLRYRPSATLHHAEKKEKPLE